MAHHAHKLADTNLEEDNCEIMCLDLLLLSDNTDFFSLYMEYVSFLLAPHIVESEHKMEIQAYFSTNISTDLNKANSDWNYMPVKGVNLIYYCYRFYVPQTLSNSFIKWYHLYLQHPGGDKLSQILITVFRPSVIIYQ